MENKTIISTKTLLVIVSVIVIAVLGLILFVQYRGGFGIPVATPPEISIPEATPPSPPEESAVEEPARVEEIMREAIDTQNASLCEKLGKEEDRKSCRVSVIFAEAGIKEDPNICNQLEEEAERLVCKDNVIITQAMNARDPGLCENMVDKTRIGQCKEDVAVLK